MITISNLSLEDTKKELILLLERYPTNFVASHSKLWPFLRRPEWSEIGLYLTLEVPSLALSMGNDIVALTEAKILPPFTPFLHFTRIKAAAIWIIKIVKDMMNAIQIDQHGLRALKRRRFDEGRARDKRTHVYFFSGFAGN